MDDAASDVSATIYCVEEIQARRYNKSRKRDEFLVRWVGYDESADSWEPLKNLDGCEEMLEEFYERERQAQDGGGVNGAKTKQHRRRGVVSSNNPNGRGSRKRGAKPSGAQRQKKANIPATLKRRATISDCIESEENEETQSEVGSKSAGGKLLREEPDVEPSDAGIPFNPDGPLVMIEPADGDDGFDRGWKMQAFVGLQLRPAAVGEGVREAWVGVKFAGYRRCQWIHISRVEEYEREALKQFLLQRLRESVF